MGRIHAVRGFTPRTHGGLRDNEVSRTQTSNPEPEPLLDPQLGRTRVHEAELAARVQTPKLAVPLHGCPAIGAELQHRHAIENATIALGMSIEHLDHEPLIGMGIAHLYPAHTSR
jgi:hypothetical protein